MTWKGIAGGVFAPSEEETLTLHELELPSPATTHSNVADQTSLHQVMERLHRLLDWRLFIEPVALQYVDVV